MSSVLLGLDLGTSSLKALAIDPSGRVLGQASAGYPTAMPHPGWAEQDPDDWWTAVTEATRQLSTLDAMRNVSVAAIGLTGQMHGPVLLDERGLTLGPCLIWSDSRTLTEVDEVGDAIGPERLIATTGSAANASYTGVKLLWLRRHRPALFERTRHVVLPKDLLGYWLTGRLLTDFSDASATLLFDVVRREWSHEILLGLGLLPQLLPAAHASSSISGPLLPKPARELGLDAGIPVVVGGGDAPTAALALGLDGSDPTVGLLTLGTSGQLLVASAQPRLDRRGRLHTLCHVLPEQWCVMAAILSAGASLNWVSRLVGAGVPVQQLLKEAAGVPGGAQGVLFAPYLSGERTPHMDAGAAGTFVGLRAAHGRAELVRAALEGVAFAFRDGLEAQRQAGLEVSVVRCTGGGARSPLWCQILASVLNRRVEVLYNEQGSAYGAALLAGSGIGVLDIHEIQRPQQVAARHEPIEPLVSVYDEHYGRYARLYEATRKFALPLQLPTGTATPAH